MIADYHMHLRDESEQIAHRADAVEPFVETARARGLDEIGFSEHVFYFKETRSLWTVPYQVERCVYEIEPYVEAVLAARERGMPVKLGLEVDYVPGHEEETRDLLAPYPWDYLLGSVHFIDGFGVDGPPRLAEEIGIEPTYRRYFETLVLAARSGLFDSLSHPDLVKVFGARAEFDYSDVAAAIAGAGVAVEVSTGGLRKPVRELYPHPDFLTACRTHGVPVTLGSDAHVPSLVGLDFDKARELLRSCGYETITVFQQRRARQEPLA